MMGPPPLPPLPMVIVVCAVLVTSGASGTPSSGSSGVPGTHWEYQGLFVLGVGLDAGIRWGNSLSDCAKIAGTALRRAGVALATAFSVSTRVDSGRIWPEEERRTLAPDGDGFLRSGRSCQQQKLDE